MKRCLTIHAVILVGFGLSLFSLNSAHSKSLSLHDESQLQPEEKFLVSLKITLSNGGWIIVRQQNRGIVRLETDKWRIIIVPDSYDRKTVVAQVRVFTKSSYFAESIVMIQAHPLIVEGAKSLIGIQIRNIELIDLSTRRIYPAIQSGQETNVCCVTCNGVRACACAVSASCGACCVGDCCG